MDPLEILNAPLDESEDDKRLQEIEAGRKEILDKPGATFARGVGRGLLGPIPDMMRGDADRELVRRQDEASPIADIAGRTAGFIGGAVTGTGLSGAVAKGAAQAGKLAGSSVLGRTAITGTAEGLGLGLMEGTTKSAMDGRLGAPGSYAEIAKAAGMGMAFGAPTGLLSGVLSKTANYMFRKGAERRLTEMAKAREGIKDGLAKKKALDLELEKLDNEMTPEQVRMAREFGEVTGTYQPHNDILGMPGASSITPPAPAEGWQGVLQALGKRGRPAGRMTEVQRQLDNGYKKVQRIADISVREFADKADGAINSVENKVLDLAAVATGGLPGLFMSRLARPTLHAMSASLLDQVAKVKPVREILSRSLQAGKLTVRRHEWADGILKELPGKYDNLPKVASSMAKSLRVPPVSYLSQKEYEETVQELAEAKSGEAEMMMRAAVASKGLPQELVDAQVEQEMRVIQYLQSNMPQTQPPMGIADNSQRNMGDESRARFSRRIRAAMIPNSVITDFVGGELTSEAADAWWKTQPFLAEYYAKQIADIVQLGTIFGQKYNAKQQYQIGLMTDPSFQTLGRLYGQGMVQFLQGNYTKEQEQNPAPQVGGPPHKPVNMPTKGADYMSANQALSKRKM